MQLSWFTLSSTDRQADSHMLCKPVGPILPKSRDHTRSATILASLHNCSTSHIESSHTELRCRQNSLTGVQRKCHLDMKPSPLREVLISTTVWPPLLLLLRWLSPWGLELTGELVRTAAPGLGGVPAFELDCPALGEFCALIFELEDDCEELTTDVVKWCGEVWGLRNLCGLCFIDTTVVFGDGGTDGGNILACGWCGAMTGDLNGDPQAHVATMLVTWVTDDEVGLVGEGGGLTGVVGVFDAVEQPLLFSFSCCELGTWPCSGHCVAVVDRWCGSIGVLGIAAKTGLPLPMINE